MSTFFVLALVLPLVIVAPINALMLKVLLARMQKIDVPFSTAYWSVATAHFIAYALSRLSRHVVQDLTALFAIAIALGIATYAIVVYSQYKAPIERSILMAIVLAVVGYAVNWACVKLAVAILFSGMTP